MLDLIDFGMALGFTDCLFCAKLWFDLDFLWLGWVLLYYDFDVLTELVRYCVDCLWFWRLFCCFDLELFC